MRRIYCKSVIFSLILIFTAYVTASETVHSQTKDSDSKTTNEIVEGSGSIDNTAGGYTGIRGTMRPPIDNSWIILAVLFVAAIVVYIIVSNNDNESQVDGQTKTQDKNKAKAAESDTLSINLD